MEIVIHAGAEKALNKKAEELLSLMIEKDEPKVDIPRPVTHGSAHYRKSSGFVLDARNEPQIFKGASVEGTSLDIFEVYQNKAIGFDQDTYKEYEKFLFNLFKQKHIFQKVSYEYISNWSFKWFLNHFKNKQNPSEYISSLINDIKSIIKNYEYRFELVHLDIEKPFVLGNVKFEYLTPDSVYFKEMTLDPKFIEEYCGKVYATYSLSGVEGNRGEKIAYKECCKAVNVLKLFSKTVKQPNYLTCFDIDRRARVTKHYESLVRNLDDNHDFSVKMTTGIQGQAFGSDHIDYILSIGKGFVNLTTIEAPNELQRMLLHALDIFSEAISNPNIHYRVVELFSIWESLLLKDESSPITDSICEYGSRLTHEGDEHIKTFKSFLQKMYCIRSAVVHHAKREELNLRDVNQFQEATIKLMGSVIYASNFHQTKQSMLENLDRMFNLSVVRVKEKTE